MKSCERHLGKFTNSWVGLQDYGFDNSFFWGTLTSSHSYPQTDTVEQKTMSCVTFSLSPSLFLSLSLSSSARLKARVCQYLFISYFYVNLVWFHFSFFRGCSLNTRQMMKIWDPCVNSPGRKARRRHSGRSKRLIPEFVHGNIFRKPSKLRVKTMGFRLRYVEISP
jgi:hypothetical protein